MVRMAKPAILGMLVVLLGTAAWAIPPRETKLNGVKLGWSFSDVLTACGMPHGIGPAVGSVEEIWNLIDPPENLSVVADDLSSMSAPGLPQASSPRLSMYAGMKNRAYYLRPRHSVWMYVGDSIANKLLREKPDPNSEWATYVIFNEQGKVVGVVVMQDHPDVRVPAAIRTTSGVSFNSTLLDVSRLYTWPDPLIQYEGFFFCHYPEQNIAFTIDVNTRRVTTIAIGMPVTVSLVEKRSTVREKIKPVSQPATPGGMPGSFPPGMMAPPGGVLPPGMMAPPGMTPPTK